MNYHDRLDRCPGCGIGPDGLPGTCDCTVASLRRVLAFAQQLNRARRDTLEAIGVLTEHQDCETCQHASRMAKAVQ